MHLAKASRSQVRAEYIRVVALNANIRVATNAGRSVCEMMNLKEKLYELANKARETKGDSKYIALYKDGQIRMFPSTVYSENIVAGVTISEWKNATDRDVEEWVETFLAYDAEERACEGEDEEEAYCDWFMSQGF